MSLAEFGLRADLEEAEDRPGYEGLSVFTDGNAFHCSIHNDTEPVQMTTSIIFISSCGADKVNPQKLSCFV